MDTVAGPQVSGTSQAESSIPALDISQPKIWGSEVDVTIPSADILTFAFANLDQYDQDKPIFISAEDPSKFVSARDARFIIRKLIRGLKERGFKKGDCVCIHAFNNIWYPLVWLAVIGAGGIVSGSHPAYKTGELIHHLEITEAKFVVAQNKTLDVVEEAVKRCGIPLFHVFLFDEKDLELPTVQSLKALQQFGESDWNSSTDNGSIADEIAVYASTSGTTGKPKVAKLSHSYYTAQAVMMEARLKDRPYNPKQLIALPIYHAFAAQLALILPLRLGIRTYLMSKFVIQDFTRVVNYFGITDTAIVPRILADLVDSPQYNAYLQSLRYVFCAGAPITATLQAKLYQYLSPDATIAQSWGATEIGWAASFGPLDKDLTGSVGTLQPGVELKLVHAEGHTINEDNVQGEAYIRSPSMMKGYHNKLTASTKAIDGDGFYRTGDLCYVVDGKLYLDGRVKDTMKVNGWQVSPAEIEAVLMQHSWIKDVAVRGYDTVDDKGLPVTLPQAFVVLKGGVAPSSRASPATPPESSGEDEDRVLSAGMVTEFAATRLASYKHLRGGVRFVSTLPVNSLGKVIRSELIPFEPPMQDKM